jgi:hypothetical protein
MAEVNAWREYASVLRDSYLPTVGREGVPMTVAITDTAITVLATAEAALRVRIVRKGTVPISAQATGFAPQAFANASLASWDQIAH